MSHQRKILLTGFMGSGKTSIGEKLAKRWNLPFIDLDSEIENATGQSVNEIFSDKGEEAFRALELERLEYAMNREGALVISTGGGAICSEDAQNLIRNCYKVFLNVPVQILAGRLRSNKADRPLIKDIPDEALHKWIEKKMEDRKPYYHRADLSINSADMTIGQIANAIEDQLM